MNRGGQHGSRSRLTGAGLIMHAEFAQNILCVGQYIHEVADGRALIAAHIAYTIFQQCFGDGQNALTAENLALACAKFLDHFYK